eukprot:jgi/Botrbrau1/2872/Bobra.0036s0017.1
MVMHEGWADSNHRDNWQAAANRIETLRDAIECLLELENWVCLDYLPGSVLESTQAWIEKVDESDVRGLQQHVQDFKKDVLEAAHTELRSSAHVLKASDMQEQGAPQGGAILSDTNLKGLKERKPRWSTSRITARKQAVANVVNTLRDLRASSRKTAVDRSKVREAARRYIGDTGLIDYCIANWFEKVVEEDTGCILRRQICSTTGKMVFWLQCSPAEGPSSGRDYVEEVPEASSDEAAALGIVGKKRKEHPQDSYGDFQGSTTPVQAELMRLGKRVHSLEDDLTVHKEYCTGIFEALFSSMKDKDLERKKTEESLVEILKRYSDRIKALERRDRGASASAATGVLRDHSIPSAAAQPSQGPVGEAPDQAMPETGTSGPAPAPPLQPYFSASGAGGTTAIPVLFPGTRGLGPSPDDLRRAILNTIMQGQQQEAPQGTTPGQGTVSVAPVLSGDPSGPPKLVHKPEAGPGLFGSPGTVQFAAGTVPIVAQPGGNLRPPPGGESGASRAGQYFAGNEGFPGNERPTAFHPDGAPSLFGGPALSQHVLRGGLREPGTPEGPGGPMRSELSPDSSRLLSMPAGIPEGNIFLGHRATDVSKYLSGLQRILVPRVSTPSAAPPGPPGQDPSPRGGPPRYDNSFLAKRGSPSPRPRLRGPRQGAGTESVLHGLHNTLPGSSRLSPKVEVPVQASCVVSPREKRDLAVPGPAGAPGYLVGLDPAPTGEAHGGEVSKDASSLQMAPSPEHPQEKAP